MRLDLFIKKNLACFLENVHINDIDKKNLIKLPRSFWIKQINFGNVKFNEKKVKPSIRIEDFQKNLVIFSWKKILKHWSVFIKEKLMAYPGEINILLNKNDYLVINKSVPLIVHPAFPLRTKQKREPTLIERVIYYFPQIRLEQGKSRPGIVHRLDNETSGAIIIAKNEKAASFFKETFKKKMVTKTYLALVEGDIGIKPFYIRSYLGKKKGNPLLRAACGLKVIYGSNMNDCRKYDNNYDAAKKILINPKMAVTAGKLIACDKLEGLANQIVGKNILKAWYGKLNKKYLKLSDRRFSLVEIAPLTGRTHQIRIHLANLGFPVVGDKLYGKWDGPSLKSLSFHCLHAYKIRLKDTEGKIVTARANKVIWS